jgi:hypothetical protein
MIVVGHEAVVVIVANLGNLRFCIRVSTLLWWYVKYLAIDESGSLALDLQYLASS